VEVLHGVDERIARAEAEDLDAEERQGQPQPPEAQPPPRRARLADPECRSDDRRPDRRPEPDREYPREPGAERLEQEISHLPHDR
jgi:hypothetical protein